MLWKYPSAQWSWHEKGTHTATIPSSRYSHTHVGCRIEPFVESTGQQGDDQAPRSQRPPQYRQHPNCLIAQPVPHCSVHQGWARLIKIMFGAGAMLKRGCTQRPRDRPFVSQSAQFCLSGSEQNAITTDSQPSIWPDRCFWPIGFRPDCVLFGLRPADCNTSSNSVRGTKHSAFDQSDGSHGHHVTC